MKFALLMVLCPFLIFGQDASHRMPLDQVMERFATIDPDGPDDQYTSILEQLRRNGMTLESGMRRQLRQHSAQVSLALQKECGFNEVDMRAIALWVARAKRENKKTYVQSADSDLLLPDVMSYIEILFTQKKCKGGLRICHEPDATSLVRLDDDISVSIKPKTSHINGCRYSEHVLIINDQFRNLDSNVQRAFMHFFICTIAADHRLWNALMVKKTKVMRSIVGAMAISNSPAAQAYREHMMMESFGQCLLDDPKLAEPIGAIFDLYEDASQWQQKESRHNHFYTGYPRCNDWITRLRRFMAVDEQIKQTKKH